MPQQLVRLMREWDGEYRPRDIERRQCELGALGPAQWRELCDMVGLARDGRERLLALYANLFTHVLRTESRCGTTLNPKFLLDLAGTSGDGVMHRHLRFEAVSIFDLAQMLAWVENQPGESRFSVGEDMAQLIDLFTRSLFEEGTQVARVFTYHEPDDHFHVRDVCLDRPPSGYCPSHVLEHSLVCRTFSNGRLVLLDHRPKGLFETAIKILKQFKAGKASWHRVFDRRGIKLIVPTVEDAHVLMDLVEAMAKEHGGKFVRGHSNITGNGTARMDADNQHSSPFFKAAKCEFSFNNDAREWVFEVLIATFQDHFSSMYATDQVNHELYRLTQALEVYLPLLWPQSVYRVDWKSSEVQNLLIAQVQDRLVRRFHPVRRS